MKTERKPCIEGLTSLPRSLFFLLLIYSEELFVPEEGSSQNIKVFTANTLLTRNPLCADSQRGRERDGSEKERTFGLPKPKTTTIRKPEPNPELSITGWEKNIPGFSLKEEHHSSDHLPFSPPLLPGRTSGNV